MKKGQFQLEPVDLNKVVLDVSTLLESDALIREMTIERDLSPRISRPCSATAFSCSRCC